MEGLLDLVSIFFLSRTTIATAYNSSCLELYGDTICKIVIREREISRLRIDRGVRQGCPLSPMLFNIDFADLESEKKKVQEGGLVLGRKKIYTLSYADDVILLANNATRMKEMLRRIRRYIERKGLELNVKKSKMMEFRKGGRRKIVEFYWGAEKIESVREFNYLDYNC